MAQTLTSAEVAAQLAGGGAEQPTLNSAQVAQSLASGGDPGYVAGLARSLLGQGALMGWGDEALAKLRSLAGEDYDQSLADERAKVAGFRQQNPGTSIAAEIGGGFLTPGIGLAAGMIRPAASTLGRMTQAAKIGAGLGSVAGAGSAQGDTSRLEGAMRGGLVGAAVAPAFPLAGTILSGAARQASNLGPTRFSAPEAGADRAMIRTLRGEGRTPADLRAQLAEADRVGTFHPAGQTVSRTESPMALADLTPGMRQLSGSIVRSSPAARTRGETFFRARQSGTPPDTPAGQAGISGTGIYTRNPLGREGMAKGEPAGQRERSLDALKRSFQLIDTKHHGHQANTYLTKQAIIQEGRDTANKLYGDLRTVSAGFDITPHLKPAMDKWTTELAQSPFEEARLIRAALRQFTMGDGKNRRIVDSVDAFDKAKRALDSRIDSAMSALNPDRNAARVLQMIKDDMVAAIDGVTERNIGQMYKVARSQFATDAQLREAMEFGRDVLKGDIHEVTTRYHRFNDTQQKLARLGVIEAFEGKGIDRAKFEDLTRNFETPRVQELLRNMVPRTESTSGVYADRPERIGAFMANERTMANTPRAVMGGSQTAERMADDAAFSRETLSSMVERFRGVPSVTNIVIEAASVVINKAFGYREEVAAALARRLFTANRATQEQVIARLEAQWGVDRVARVVSAIESTALTAAAGTSASSARTREPARIPARAANL